MSDSPSKIFFTTAPASCFAMETVVSGERATRQVTSVKHPEPERSTL
jgi:hypothetical protein